MAETTGISWADATFNPWIGCSKVSPGCAHCYAETLVTGSGPRQLNRPGTWGDAGTRQRTAASTWAKPRTWERQAAAWHAEHGRPRRVFCASLADAFEPRPELEPWRDDLFRLIAATPSLVWMILTKRPDVARDYIDARLGPRFPEEFPNVWLGTSIENARHTFRADVLRECRVALRFLSCEPLLGSLTSARSSRTRCPECRGISPDRRDRGDVCATCENEGTVPAAKPLDLTGIDWVIVGGESGPGARPIHPAWVREIRDACLEPIDSALAAMTAPGYDGRLLAVRRPAFHFKQWGAWTPDPHGRDPEAVWLAPDGTVRTSIEADALGHIAVRSVRMRHAGVKPTAGGKLLDGVDWCEVPDAHLNQHDQLELA